MVSIKTSWWQCRDFLKNPKYFTRSRHTKLLKRRICPLSPLKGRSCPGQGGDNSGTGASGICHGPGDQRNYRPATLYCDIVPHLTNTARKKYCPVPGIEVSSYHRVVVSVSDHHPDMCAITSITSEGVTSVTSITLKITVMITLFDVASISHTSSLLAKSNWFFYHGLLMTFWLIICQEFDFHLTPPQILGWSKKFHSLWKIVIKVFWLRSNFVYLVLGFVMVVTFFMGLVVPKPN